MADLNSVAIIGIVAKNPEPIGMTTRISIEVADYRGDYMTFGAIAFNKTAEYINDYISKGDAVVVSGSLMKSKNSSGSYETVISIRQIEKIRKGT